MRIVLCDDEQDILQSTSRLLQSIFQELCIELELVCFHDSAS